MGREDQDPFGGDWYEPADNAPAPAIPPPTSTKSAPAAIPTNPGGQQVGSGVPWQGGQPNGAPPGYTWDPNYAMFVPTPGSAGTGQTGAQPAGGQLTNNDYANQLVWWAGGQSGVNPSVQNDPGYWLDKLQSGAFGNDQAYAVKRMMQPEGPPEGGGPPTAPGSSGGSGGNNYYYGPTFNPGSYSSPYAPPAGISAQLYNMLMTRAQQGTELDKNDANIKQQVNPFAASQERSRRNYLAQVAERGGPLANINGEQRITAEKAGQNTSMFQSQLIGREIQSRRDEIQAALTQLGTQLNADQSRALQDELGHLNAALSQYGIDTSAGLQQQQINSGNDQFAANFGLNSTNQANYWDSVRRGII